MRNWLTGYLLFTFPLTIILLLSTSFLLLSFDPSHFGVNVAHFSCSRYALLPTAVSGKPTGKRMSLCQRIGPELAQNHCPPSHLNCFQIKQWKAHCTLCNFWFPRRITNSCCLVLQPKTVWDKTSTSDPVEIQHDRTHWSWDTGINTTKYFFRLICTHVGLFYPAGAHTHSSCLSFTFLLCVQLSQAEFTLRSLLLCSLMNAPRADAWVPSECLDPRLYIGKFGAPHPDTYLHFFAFKPRCNLFYTF